MLHRNPRARLRWCWPLLLTLVICMVGATAPAAGQSGAAANPQIAALMNQVDSNALMDFARRLSGAAPAQVGGAPYTFTTRDTESGEPITKATQLAYEHMAAQGLPVTYRAWTQCGLTHRNVVAEKPGSAWRDEFVLVSAHIDSISDTASAPGADDNASGAVAVMTLAELLAPVSLQRTVRFILFTGEEQGMCGSQAYARAAAGAGEEIVAVFNLDMIAWSTQDEPIVRLHTRRPSATGYSADLAIANTFVAVVNDYGLGEELTPRISADGEDASDHGSFWAQGYPAILAIEDDGGDGDFNPYYHSADDRVTEFNQAYYTNFVKASLGTVAELAGVTPAPIQSFRLHLPSVQRRQ